MRTFISLAPPYLRCFSTSGPIKLELSRSRFSSVMSSRLLSESSGSTSGLEANSTGGQLVEDRLRDPRRRPGVVAVSCLLSPARRRHCSRSGKSATIEKNWFTVGHSRKFSMLPKGSARTLTYVAGHVRRTFCRRKPRNPQAITIIGWRNRQAIIAWQLGGVHILGMQADALLHLDRCRFGQCRSLR